jgi:hypothetical protein
MLLSLAELKRLEVLIADAIKWMESKYADAYSIKRGNDVLGLTRQRVWDPKTKQYRLRQTKRYPKRPKQDTSSEVTSELGGSAS